MFPTVTCSSLKYGIQLAYFFSWKYVALGWKGCCRVCLIMGCTVCSKTGHEIILVEEPYMRVKQNKGICFLFTWKSPTMIKEKGHDVSFYLSYSCLVTIGSATEYYTIS